MILRGMLKEHGPSTSFFRVLGSIVWFAKRLNSRCTTLHVEQSALGIKADLQYRSNLEAIAEPSPLPQAVRNGSNTLT